MSGFDLGEFEHRLRAVAFAFPETSEDHPWGETAYKVRGKAFVFLHASPEALSLTVKLPASRDFATMFDFAAPAGYGLGRSGWITCRLDAGSDADPDLLLRWVGESWRAVAPKRLAAIVPEAED
jgi:predicted DNA-binding protein (MmcQ/YjbR family)